MSFIYSVEVAYPSKDTTVLALLRSSCIVIGNAVSNPSNLYLQRENDKPAVTVLILCFSGSLVLGLIFALLMKPINSSEAPSKNLATGSFVQKAGKESILFD